MLLAVYNAFVIFYMITERELELETLILQGLLFRFSHNLTTGRF